MIWKLSKTEQENNENWEFYAVTSRYMNSNKMSKKYLNFDTLKIVKHFTKCVQSEGHFKARINGSK